MQCHKMREQIALTYCLVTVWVKRRGCQKLWDWVCEKVHYICDMIIHKYVAAQFQKIVLSFGFWLKTESFHK